MTCHLPTMGFRLIPASRMLGLTANEAYTYFCLLIKSDFNTYISHVKLDTLSELTGIKETEYISKHINTLISKDLILYKDKQRHLGNKGVFDTCTYYLYKPENDWIRIDTDFLQADISNKLKGFLILLKCLCLNNTNYTGYNKSKISELLHISRPTLNAYLNQCIEIGLVKENEKGGYAITDTHLFKVDAVKNTPDRFYSSVREYLQQRGLIPPVYEKKYVWKMMYHFSGSPNYMIKALQEKKIPYGTNCTWAYLAKVLNVNITEKPTCERCSCIL